MVQHIAYKINHNFFYSDCSGTLYKVPDENATFSSQLEKNVIIKLNLCFTVLGMEKTELACFVGFHRF